MAKYKTQKYCQLLVKATPLLYNILQCHYKVIRALGGNVKNSDLKRFKSNMTDKIIAYDSNEVIKLEIYLNNKKEGECLLTHYDESFFGKKYNIIDLKSAKAANSKNENNIKVASIPIKTEIGWKLIKKEQTFDSLIREVYKKYPSSTELNIFRHANAHLDDLQINLANTIKPGQVVIFSNKASSPELSQYQALAREAERVYKIYIRKKGFDPVFFANNFELLLDYLSYAQQAHLANLEYMKTVKGHQSTYCQPWSLNPTNETVNTVSGLQDGAKKISDDLEIKRLNMQKMKEVSLELQKLQIAFDKEKRSGSKLANPKHYNEFQQKNSLLYQKLNTLISQNFEVMQNNKEIARTLKNVVKDTSGVKASDYMGGLKLSVQHMENIAKATISLRVGAKLVLYFGIVESASKVYTASETGDVQYTVKVATVESFNIGGGVLLGWAGGVLGKVVGTAGAVVLGLSTGGVAIVGMIVAVAGGVGGGMLGSYLGTGLGKELTGVCK